MRSSGHDPRRAPRARSCRRHGRRAVDARSSRPRSARRAGWALSRAGYKSPDAIAERIAGRGRSRRRPFGVNLFSPTGPAGRSRRRRRLRRAAHGVDPGADRGAPRRRRLPRRSSTRVLAAPPAVVSFTFGCPERARDRRRAARRRAEVVGDGHRRRRGGLARAWGRRARRPGRRGRRAPRLVRRRRRRADSGCSRCSSSWPRPVTLPLVATGGIATGPRPWPRSPRARPPRSAPRSCAPEAATAGATARRRLAGRPASPARSPAASRAGSSTPSCRAQRRRPGRLSRGPHLTAPMRAAARKAGDAEAMTCGPARRMSWSRPGRRGRSWRRWLGMRPWLWSGLRFGCPTDACGGAIERRLGKGVGVPACAECRASACSAWHSSCGCSRHA